MSERAGRVWHLVTFAVAVFALVFQLVLIVRGDSVLDEANAPGTPEAVRRYFFYFTIQANALVAFTSWLVPWLNLPAIAGSMLSPVRIFGICGCPAIAHRASDAIVRSSAGGMDGSED